MKITLSIISVAALVTAGFSHIALADLKTETLAPDFSLTDSHGQSHTLSGFRDKYVVLEWSNHDCPFVVKHYKSGNMQKEVTDQGAIRLKIISSAPGEQGYCTPAEANRIVARDKSSLSAVLLDPEGTVGRLYSARTTPHIYIIDPKGTLIYQGGIDSIKSTDISDIPKAKNYVRAALNEAMAGSSVTNNNTRPHGCSIKYASK